MILEVIESRKKYIPGTVLFPVWARTPAKETLGVFTTAMKQRYPSCKVIAYVDNVLPMLLFARSVREQLTLDDSYRVLAPGLGFDDVVFSSATMLSFSLENFFETARRFTTRELSFVVPSHKKDLLGDFGGCEFFEFVWQARACEVGLRELCCDGLVAGMATRHFYYTARKLFPDINIYFARGKPPTSRPD